MKSRTLKLVLTCAFALALSRTADARLGETPEQVAARYGPALSSSEGLSVHTKNGIKVVAEYLAGRAEIVQFINPKGFSQDEFWHIARANGAGAWTRSRVENTKDGRIGFYSCTTGEFIFAIVKDAKLQGIFLVSKAALATAMERFAGVETARKRGAAARVKDF